MVAAACGSTTPSSGVTTTSTPTAATPTTAPESTAPSDRSAAPAESQAVESQAPTPTATEVPTPTATEAPVESTEPSVEPSSSVAATTADGCTGSDANRQFFSSVALAVDWTVLCGALPKGWFLSTGTYRLANGGRLLVSYKGPSGATLALSEGAYCSFPGACVPAGTQVGDAAMGPLTGLLIEIDGGGYAIVVDPARNLGWLLEAHGLDEATTRDLAAALFEVAG